MNPDLERLLALQECDQALDRLAAVSRALDVREQEMKRERAALAAAVERARAALVSEQQRERELQRSADEHRTLRERFASQMDVVRKPKEAAAATTQLEMAQRVVASDEAELHSMQGRIRDLEQSAQLHEMELADVDERRKEDREALASDRAKLGEEIAEARARRDTRATDVPRQLLTRYDRLRTRGHAAVIVKLEGASCGNCRTAIPMQRRNEILAGRRIDACEGCGVLLYA